MMRKFMNMFVTNLLVSIVLVKLINCSLYTPHPCPAVKPVKNFDWKQVRGDWYPLIITSSVTQGGRCLRSYFNLINDQTLEIRNNWIDANGKPMYLAVNDTLTSTPGEIKSELEVTINGLLKKEKKNVTVHTNVVDTDYVNYQVIYTCYQIEHFWISEKVDTYGILIRTRYFDSIRKLIPVFRRLPEYKVDANSIGFLDNDITCAN